jgi:hypothetical protein
VTTTTTAQGSSLITAVAHNGDADADDDGSGVHTERRGRYDWILDVDKNAEQPQMNNFFVAPSNAGFSAAQRRRMRLQTAQNNQINVRLKGEVQEMCRQRVELRTARKRRRLLLLMRLAARARAH